ncbi:MAG: hypothetical protein KQH57_18585 [Actinomycetales bacterium]|nr:hypothetical protein [Actinomycetales bacterium]
MARPVSNTGERICWLPYAGEAVPCHDPAWGWFSDADACYYLLRDPQPPATEAVWGGHFPDGAVYLVTCLDPLHAPGTNGGWTWLPSPPPGYGGISVTPGELAQRAVQQMALTGPAIGATITDGELGIVGVPVWLWTAVTPTTWGPNSATASVPGLSVTATAQATRIDWDMGDGSVVSCANPGTPYRTGEVHSPTCEHTYAQPSLEQPGEAYTVVGTTTWEVSWSGGGTSGTLTVTRAAQTSVRIGELQVLVTG